MKNFIKTVALTMLLIISIVAPTLARATSSGIEVLDSDNYSNSNQYDYYEYQDPNYQSDNYLTFDTNYGVALYQSDYDRYVGASNYAEIGYAQYQYYADQYATYEDPLTGIRYYQYDASRYANYDDPNLGYALYLEDSYYNEPRYDR